MQAMRVDNMGYKVKFLNYHPYFNSEILDIKTAKNHLLIDFVQNKSSTKFATKTSAPTAFCFA